MTYVPRQPLPYLATEKPKGRILIVDDAAENREVLAKRLQREGHQPHMAASAEEALALLQTHVFDLVLCDLLMPGVDGMQLLQELKANPETAHIPVIIMSVLDDLEAVVQAIEQGAEDYLPKPFSPVLLRARLNACLDKKMLRDRERQYVSLLHQELSAAARLQQSILPKEPIQHVHVQVASFIKAASEVGGDFYDYFWLKPDQLAFIIADVSGKGLTGALFMAISRTLLKVTSSLAATPNECLRMVNQVLCEHNDTMMFVTAFYGILDITTGQLQYVNAGHCLPLHLSHAGGSKKVAFLPAPQPACNPALGVVPEAHFTLQTLQLSAGDQLLLYTDGISEAFNPAGSSFGIQPLLELAETQSSFASQSGLQTVYEAVLQFAQGAPQSDDITLLALSYTPPLGATPRRVQQCWTLPATRADLAHLTAAVEAFCHKIGVPARTLYHILLTLDELVSNVISHGLKPGEAGTIAVKISPYHQGFKMMFRDDSHSFNPMQVTPPSLTSTLENRDIGGLGIHFIKSFALSMRYRRYKRFNHLWFVFGARNESH